MSLRTASQVTVVALLLAVSLVTSGFVSVTSSGAAGAAREESVLCQVTLPLCHSSLPGAMNSGNLMWENRFSALFV
jgi:hypothetical protein